LCPRPGYLVDGPFYLFFLVRRSINHDRPGSSKVANGIILNKTDSCRGAPENQVVSGCLHVSRRAQTGPIGDHFVIRSISGSRAGWPSGRRADNGVVAGGRLTDWVSLGVPAAFVLRDAVDDAVAAADGSTRFGHGRRPKAIRPM
jgi:hypothetical protein